MSEPIVALRHTISKQVQEYPESVARQQLEAWPDVLEEVRTAKPEVLSEPFTLDENMDRTPTEKNEI